jgi:hypothetical protein
MLLTEVQMDTITKYALDAQAVLSKTGRSSRIVGWGDPPLTAHYQNGWKLEILRPDQESTIPSEVKTRLNLLRNGGVRFDHILIAHELPKPVKRLEVPKEVIQVASDMLPVLGSILGALASLLGLLVMGIGRILLFLIAVDPVVIVVLEDKTWLEIATWYD